MDVLPPSSGQFSKAKVEKVTEMAGCLNYAESSPKALGEWAAIFPGSKFLISEVSFLGVMRWEEPVRHCGYTTTWLIIFIDFVF